MAKSKKAKINLKPKEKKKSLIAGNELIILRIGVIVLALIIFGLWIFIQNNSWRSNQNLVDLDELTEILNKPVPGYEENEGSGEQTNNEDQETDNEEAIDKETEELIDRIIKEADERNKANTSSCPEWINCMPTIGEARSCNIPPGCEGITQIAW